MLVEEAGAVASQTTNYDGQANQLLADRLQGKLLLAHGLMDDNVHPSNTLLVVQALIDAEKDFDLSRRRITMAKRISFSPTDFKASCFWRTA